MYQIDPTNGDIVINGFEKGIGDSPYAGLVDVKSMNLSGVPGEAAVNFSTQSVNQVNSYTNASLSVDANRNLNFNATLGDTGYQFLEDGQAIVILTSTISGLAAGTTPLWVYGSSNQGGGLEWFRVVSSYGSNATLTLGTTGTATFSTINMATPKFFDSMNSGVAGTNFMLDSAGRLWSDRHLTTGGTSITSTSSWTFAGNTTFSDSNGNGLVYWRTANGTAVGDWDGWLLIFRDGAIDYSNVNGVNNGVAYDNTGIYVYGWNPDTATTGQSSYLTGVSVSACPHKAIVGPDGNVYYCDYFTMGKIQQFNIVSPVTTFSPTNSATFIFTQAHNLPIQEISTCIAPLGNDFIIGGRGNKAYIWNGVDQLTYTNAVLLAESYVHNIITVNTNAFIFCGNRGNIYITNGSQANVWKKVPDHISGTVEPYFIWGGAAYQKNRIYFGVYAQTNAASALSGYGGVWVIDLPTGAMWLSNQLSYGAYTGYATAIYAIPPIPAFPVATPQLTEPAGVGLFVGWSNSSTYGVDSTVSTPYTGGQSYLISDMIPVGTLLRPTTPLQFEFKTSKPLLAGESVQLLVSSSLMGTFTSAGTTSGDSTGTIFSGNHPSPVQGLQWVSVKAISTGSTGTPSYNRLTELRIIGGKPLQ